MRPVLTSLDRLTAWAPNPRQCDEGVLSLIALSLQRLGWLSPIVATAAGEIVSGHQRHRASRMLGWSHAPVVWATEGGLAPALAANRLAQERTEGPAEARARCNLDEFSAHLSALPALSCEAAAAAILANTHREPPRASPASEYQVAIARALWRRGVRMPVVIDAAGGIVHGQAWADLATEAGDAAWIVEIPSEHAALARSAMENLTANWNWDGHQIRDLLRSVAHRRARSRRSTLGRGMCQELIGTKPASSFDVSDPFNAERWRRMYGLNVLNVGAGHCVEDDMLRAIGVDVTSAEPYHCPPGRDSVDVGLSRSLMRGWIDAVASGKRWDSVFLSSVLNQVPFPEDREHLIVLAAVCCYPNGTLYAQAMSRNQPTWQVMEGVTYAGKTYERLSAIRAGWEDGAIIAGLYETPLVSRHFNNREFHQLMSTAFDFAKVRIIKNDCYAICRRPRPTAAQVEAAVRFEFDLPCPDGTRLGLVEMALPVFLARVSD